MMSFFFFFCSYLVSLKEFFIHFKHLFLDTWTIFMISIFPLVLFFIFSSIFPSSSKKDLLFFKLIFFSLFLFLFFCFSSCSSFMFLFFFESIAFMMIFFIFNYSKDYDKISSSLFMFLINVLGSIPFMFFCLKISFLPIFLFSGNSSVSLTLMTSFFMILCSKIPIFLFHFWLTKAHVSASGAGSMILASLMLKIGSMGILKWSPLFTFLFLNPIPAVCSFLLFTGVLILFLMNRFFDVKFLVACSSIVHMSLIFPLVASSSFPGVFSSLIMMVGHGISSCLLFFLVSFMYELSQDRSIVSSKSIESFSLFFCMNIIIWFILNMGFPPFISFISELMFLFTLNELSYFFSILFFLSLMYTGLYFINLILSFSFSKKNFFVSDYCFVIGGVSSLMCFISFSLLLLFF